MGTVSVVGMTWVKRGGGAGRGIYSGGLAAAIDGTAPPVRPSAREEGQAPQTDPRSRVEEPVIPPAYRPQQWMDVLDARILLDVLASYVNDGGEAEMAMIYPDTLETFGAESKHFIAACQGQAGAGAHYQQTVAGGRWANGE